MSSIAINATSEVIILVIGFAVAILLFYYFTGIGIPGAERFFGLIK